MKCILLLVIVISFVSCINNNIQNKVVASINDTINISIDDIDTRIEQELYGDLHRIYLRRLKSLNEIIDKELLHIEASRLKIPESKLIENDFNNHNNISEITLFKKNNGLEKKIPYFDGFLTYVDVNSAFGRIILNKSYQEYVNKNYFNGLRKKYNIKTFLYPPLPPKINLDSLTMLHYKGNLKSENCLLIISDIECPNCREASGIINKLFLKYSKVIRFEYTSHSEYINIGILSLEAASKQGKFWEMYDKINENPLKLDTSSYINFANQIHIDTIRFKSDLKSSKLSYAIKKNFEYLQRMKVYATPTLVLNNRIIPDLYNSDLIESEIQKLNLNE